MKKCSKCHNSGHNAKTCGKEKKTLSTPISSKRCGKCNKLGHNVRSCKTNMEEIPEGHKIILQNKQKSIIPDINGTNPQKGLWIISEKRKRIAGKILYVKKNGNVVWENILGATITSTPQVFEKSEYYYAELEPKMLDWHKGY